MYTKQDIIAEAKKHLTKLAKKRKLSVGDKLLQKQCEALIVKYS